jgi:hypothetical protein
MSTETKWTPGPWVVDGGSPSLIWAEGRERRRLGGLLVQGLLVADLAPRTVNNVPPIDERRANARLIAAAPKMYEALRESRDLTHWEEWAVDRLRAGLNTDVAVYRAELWSAALAAADGREP